MLTYMGCYNHDLEKGTHLKTNMATVEDMRRRMTKAERNRIKAGCDGVKAQWSQMNALFPSPVKWLFYLISNCPHDYFMKGIERILKVIN